jgi:hypothetical protein
VGGRACRICGKPHVRGSAASLFREVGMASRNSFADKLENEKGNQDWVEDAMEML